MKSSIKKIVAIINVFITSFLLATNNLEYAYAVSDELSKETLNNSGYNPYNYLYRFWKI